MPETQRTMTSFTPFEFDIDAEEVSCAQGAYTFEIVDVKKGVYEDKESGATFPQLNVSLRATSTEEESDACQQSVGSIIFDRIIIRPNKDQKGRMHREQLRRYLDKLEIDHTLVPSAPQTLEDYDELIAALKGQTFDAWARVSRKENPDDPSTSRTFVNLSFRAPPVSADDEVQAETSGKSAGKNGNGKHAGKGAAGKKPNGKRN